MPDTIYTPPEVEKKFGVPPALIPNLLALMGDSSDNIPGVPGIGMKTGARLLMEYGALNKVLDAARKREIKGKRGETLVNHTEDARLAEKPVALKADVDLDVELDDLVRK